VIDAISTVMGPLVFLECRRSVARGWLILVRTLVAFLLLIVLVGILGWCDLSRETNPNFQPAGTLRVAIATLDIMLLITALVMAPALMAGSLAGEKERGSLGLLLTTRVNAFEIVLGRLSGKLSQVLMMVLAAVPALVLLTALCAYPLMSAVMLLALPLAVAFGAAGISAAASSTSRRGRDALILVYLLLVVITVLPALVPVGTMLTLVSPLNPFSAIVPLASDNDPRQASISVVVWLVFGVIGITIASWRLRPACLQQVAGETRRGRKGKRRLVVPPVGDRPMLWKELFIDRVGSLGRVGRWIGLLIVLLLIGAGCTMAVLFVMGADFWVDKGMSGWLGRLGAIIIRTQIPLLCLIQWAVGLRAAVTISSERERGSWDGLLTSPLEGGEIVWGKLWGSLFALRWLFLATLWAWSITWICGMTRWNDLLTLLAHCLVVGAFMAAIGVRSSLSSATATRSMTVTIGTWLAAYAAAALAALVAAALVFVFGILLWLLAMSLQLIPQSRVPAFLPIIFPIAFQVVLLGIFLIATLMIVSETRLRFDRIAGRMSGGEVEVQLDRLLHGVPMAPVLMGATNVRPDDFTETDLIDVGNSGAEREGSAASSTLV
jgi:ABC-type transport system involved in multi-copper enzyme maturation permease subunit